MRFVLRVFISFSWVVFLYAPASSARCGSEFRIRTFVDQTIARYLHEAGRLGLKTGMEAEFMAPEGQKETVLQALAVHFRVDREATIVEKWNWEKRDVLSGINESIRFEKDYLIRGIGGLGEYFTIEMQSPRAGWMSLSYAQGLAGYAFFEFRMRPFSLSESHLMMEGLEVLASLNVLGSSASANLPRGQRNVSLQFSVDVENPKTMSRLLVMWADHRSEVLRRFQPTPRRMPHPVDREFIALLRKNEENILTYRDMNTLGGETAYQIGGSDLSPRPMVRTKDDPGNFNAAEYRIFDIEFDKLHQMRQQMEYAIALTARAHLEEMPAEPTQRTKRRFPKFWPGK